MADTVTIKDQYTYLIQEASSISEEEKKTLMAALEQGMTPELKDTLIALFEAEESAIDESISAQQGALDFYKEEMKSAGEEAQPTVTHLEQEAMNNMNSVTKDFQHKAISLEGQYEKDVEHDVRQSDNSQMDAIRQQLGIQK